MNEKLLKTISTTTWIILFLYLSGGLYLGSYWFPLKIDPTSIVSITDIPKSFLKPFFLSIGVSLFAIFVTFYTAKVFFPTDVINYFSGIFYKYESNIHIWVNRILYFAAPILFLIMIRFFHTPPVIIFTGITLILIVSLRVLLSKRIFALLKSIGLGRMFLLITIYTPMMSAIIGLYESSRVYNNKSITLIKVKTQTPIIMQSNINPTDLKFLGYLGDKLIISTLDNKKIIVLNQDKIDMVEMIKE